MTTGSSNELFLRRFEVDAPTLTVALCHGYGDHSGRYLHVAQALNAKSISVVAGDLRGHGRSPGSRGRIDDFSEYLDDLDEIVDAATDSASGGKLALVGHSMGGLIVCDWLLSRSRELCPVGAVLTSPFMGLRAIARGLLALVSPLTSTFPGFRLKGAISGGDLSHDPLMLQAHASDPLVGREAVLRTLTEVTAAQNRVMARAPELKPAMQVLYAGDDRVVDPERTARFIDRLAMSDLEAERLDGQFHEILNESPELREATLERIGTWLLRRAE